MSEQDQNQNDQLSTGLKILSFCIPLAGIILYFMNKSESPKKAKSACYAALFGAGLIIILQIIFMVLGVGLSSL